MPNKNTEKIFDVTVSRTGVVKVRATTIQEAMAAANAVPADLVAWDDGFLPTDAMEAEDSND